MSVQIKTLKPTGEAIAALMSPMIGLLAFSISNLVWEAYRFTGNDIITPFLMRLGSWVPAYDKIGPLAGKETILLAIWLGSWLVLHLVLRKREMRIAPWAIAFLIGIGVAALILWPPLIEVIVPE